MSEEKLNEVPSTEEPSSAFPLEEAPTGEDTAQERASPQEDLRKVPMDRASAGDLPDRLAVQVITQELTIDQGLIRALTGQVVRGYVDRLNKILGVPCFKVEDLYERARSGHSQKAVDGRVPLLELPTDLPDREAAPERDELTVVTEILSRQEKRLKELISEREESLGRYYLLETTERNMPRPPDPWAGPVVILVLTVFFSLLVFYVAPDFIALYLMAVSGLLGLIFAVVAYVKGRFRYLEAKRKLDLDSEQRRVKMEAFREKVDTFDDAIWNVKKTGQSTLVNARTLSREQTKKLRESHPTVFEKP
jgi:hypothetical protein